MKDRSGNKIVTYLYEGSQLMVLPYFLYEVDVYRTWNNGFALVRSRQFKSNKFLKIKNSVEIKHYDGHNLERSINLIGAPITFIKERKLPLYGQKTKKTNEGNLKRSKCRNYGG